jgi:hypothetical protein
MLETKTVTNGPMAVQLRRACHDTLPWLISFSLDAKIGSAWDSQMKAVVKGVGMR